MNASLSRLSILAALFALLPLVGCQGEGPGPDAGGVDAPDRPDAPPNPRLAVGTGEIFDPFEDGDTLDLVTGCQGSQHVWIAVRTWDINPSGVIVDLELIRDRDETVVSQFFSVRVTLTRSEEYAQLGGMTLIVPDPEMALEEDLTLRVGVRDQSGIELDVRRPIRIAWGEDGC